MTSLGLFHLSTAIAALILGAAVLSSGKGTRRHRRLGWAYVVSMAALNVSALLIYRLFGGFGPFHGFALASLATVAAGIAPAIGARRARRSRDPVRRAKLVERHYAFMTWSYVGLCAAAVSEIATRLPAFRPAPGQGAMFGIAVGVSTLVVVAGGGWVIARRRTGALASIQR